MLHWATKKGVSMGMLLTLIKLSCFFHVSKYSLAAVKIRDKLVSNSFSPQLIQMALYLL